MPSAAFPHIKFIICCPNSEVGMVMVTHDWSQCISLVYQVFFALDCFEIEIISWVNLPVNAFPHSEKGRCYYDWKMLNASNSVNNSSLDRYILQVNLWMLFCQKVFLELGKHELFMQLLYLVLQMCYWYRNICFLTPSLT